MTTTLIPARDLNIGDRLGNLTDEIITSQKVNTPDIVVYTLDTNHGPAFIETHPDTLIRILVQ